MAKKTTSKKKVSRKITKEDLTKIAVKAGDKVREIQKALMAKLAGLKKKTTKKSTAKTVATATTAAKVSKKKASKKTVAKAKSN